jgi:transposase
MPKPSKADRTQPALGDVLQGQHQSLVSGSRPVRLVRGGQATFSVARTLGISGQTLHNWVKAEAAGRLREIAGKTVSAEQMEIARLKAELAKARIERDILKKAAAYFARESR